jgi:hypothetical protein
LTTFPDLLERIKWEDKKSYEEIQSAGPPGPMSRNDAVRLTAGDLVKHPEKENRK